MLNSTDCHFFALLLLGYCESVSLYNNTKIRELSLFFRPAIYFLLFFGATINHLGSTSEIPIHERWRSHLASLWHSNIKLDYSMCELVNLSVTIDAHLQRYKKKILSKNAVRVCQQNLSKKEISFSEQHSSFIESSFAWNSKPSW